MARALAHAHARQVDAIYCLGDMGAFGPHPDRVFPLLLEHGVQCIQGNYDNSVGNGLADCQCGGVLGRRSAGGVSATGVWLR